MSKTAKELLFTGQSEEALRLMRETCATGSGAAEIMQLGTAYLWLENYIEAWEHFNSANQKQPKHTARFYEMAGISKWCMGERQMAVEQWIEGCDCDYADGAGGVCSPLLLFTASIIHPDIFARREAEKLLTVRANENRIRNWPGPVAEHVLGRINKTTLREKCVGVNPRDTESRHWLADFYLGIIGLSNGDILGHKKTMRKVATAASKYIGPGRKVFDLSDKIRETEFYIARSEAVRNHEA